jgi:hypothetical protein
MKKNSKDVVGYRQRDESKEVEYVFCKECSEREEVSNDSFITRDDAERHFYFCDACEDRLL